MGPPLWPHGRLRADRVALADVHGLRVGQRAEPGCGTLMQDRDEKKRNEGTEWRIGSLQNRKEGKKETEVRGPDRDSCSI